MDYRGGGRYRDHRQQWTKPTGPPDEHWSKYGPDGGDDDDEEEYDYDADQAPSDDYRGRDERYMSSPHKNVPSRRPKSPLDEGEVEEEEGEDDDYEPEPRYGIDKRSHSKSPGRSQSPHMRSSSPEEGEVPSHQRSPGEATPSPPAKRLRTHSPGELMEDSPPPPSQRDRRPGPPSPPMTRRYSHPEPPSPPHTCRPRPPSPGMGEVRSTRGGHSSGVMRGHMRDMRQGPPMGKESRAVPPRPAPPQTRANRRRSEEEMLPPSKRLSNMNRM